MFLFSGLAGLDLTQVPLLQELILSIASIAVTTNLAAAAGAVLAMTVSWIKYGKADVSMTLMVH